MIRVHVALDARLLREAIGDSLRRAESLIVVSLSAEGAEGTAAVQETRPDVVVFALPRSEEPSAWVTAYREAAPGTRVILLAFSRRTDEFSGCGADAVVDAGDGVDELIAAIHAVAD